MLNELPDVKIDVREYNPTEQWRRMRENQTIPGIWKYTAGTNQNAGSCIMPGRVFHQDSYNVFTNTLSINSIEPEKSLYASGTAKYMRSKENPGRFAAACHLPIVPLYRDYHVANEVLRYARVRQDWETERSLYPQIYSAFGSDLVSQATSLVPVAAYMPFYAKPILSLGGGIAGGVTGQVILKQREHALETKIEEPK